MGTSDQGKGFSFLCEDVSRDSNCFCRFRVRSGLSAATLRCSPSHRPPELCRTGRLPDPLLRSTEPDPGPVEGERCGPIRKTTRPSYTGCFANIADLVLRRFIASRRPEPGKPFEQNPEFAEANPGVEPAGRLEREPWSISRIAVAVGFNASGIRDAPESSSDRWSGSAAASWIPGSRIQSGRVAGHFRLVRSFLYPVGPEFPPVTSAGHSIVPSLAGGTTPFRHSECR